MIYFRTVPKIISKNYVGNGWKETFVVLSAVEQLSRLRFLNRALRYTYVIRTNKMHTFYINYLI
jgi:hypothetical protein